MDRLRLIDLLRSNPLFQDLDEEEIADIARLMRPADYAAGATLFRQGAPADRVLLLAAGSVAVTTRLPGDERVRLAEIGPGELIGETALNQRATRATRTACKVLEAVNRNLVAAQQRAVAHQAALAAAGTSRGG